MKTVGSGQGLCDLDEQNRLADIPFDHITRAAHGVLSRIRNTQIQDGMHVFGKPPEGEKRVNYINAILRYDAGEHISLRKSVAAGGVLKPLENRKA